jgi:hypothetical protein
MTGFLQCALEVVLLLQLLLFLFHDIFPLGRWNNLPALRAAVPARRLIVGTLMNTAIGLLALYLFHMHSMHHSRTALTWLIVLQGFMVYGEVRWWWYPYFAGASPALVARLRPNWEGTAAFVPERNGIRPNSLHCVMHALTLAAFLLAVCAKVT